MQRALLYFASLLALCGLALALLMLPHTARAQAPAAETIVLDLHDHDTIVVFINRFVQRGASGLVALTMAEIELAFGKELADQGRELHASGALCEGKQLVGALAHPVEGLQLTLCAPLDQWNVQGVLEAIRAVGFPAATLDPSSTPQRVVIRLHGGQQA